MPEQRYIVAGLIGLVCVAFLLWNEREKIAGLARWFRGSGDVSDQQAIEAAKVMAKWFKQAGESGIELQMKEYAARIFQETLH